MSVRNLLFTATILLAGCTTHQTQDMASTGGAISPTETFTSQEWATRCEKWDKWDKPAPPMHIHGTTYYVGTCGIASVLIAGDGKHILIDTGTRRGSDVVTNNLRRLGVDVERIAVILTSHEHHDHMGGHAHVQRLTDAVLPIVAESLSQMVKGKPHADDPQFTSHPETETIPREAILILDEVDGEPSRMTVGGNTISMLRTPGHTPGGLTWYWESCEADDCKTIVYADSLSPVSADDYRFSDHPEYVAAYRAGLDRLAQLDCDILLTPHPSHSKMVERAASGTFEGGITCTGYAAGKHKDLDTRLAKEAGEVAQ